MNKIKRRPFMIDFKKDIATKVTAGTLDPSKVKDTEGKEIPKGLVLTWVKIFTGTNPFGKLSRIQPNTVTYTNENVAVGVSNPWDRETVSQVTIKVKELAGRVAELEMENMMLKSSHSHEARSH